MSIARRLFPAAIAAVVTLIPAVVTAASAHTAAKPRDGRIVYTSDGQLYTVNPDGTAVVQLTHLPADQFAIYPAWFPDASRIVFVSNRGGAGVRLFVMRRDGTHVHRLFEEAGGFNDWTPAVTPDGKAVIFSRCRPDPPGGCALYSVRTDGTGLKALTHYRRGIDQQLDFWPDISPDGTQVAFSRWEHRGIAAQIWLIRVDGTRGHPITPPRLEAAVPRWMPDGAHLLVTSSFLHTGEQIYRISADGSGLQQLTHSAFPHNSTNATPSPSGDRISFVSDRAYAQPFAGGDIFVMEANGRGKDSILSGHVGDQDWGTAPLLEP